MGHGLNRSAPRNDRSTTGAKLEQRRRYAPVPPKGVGLEQCFFRAEADWCKFGALR